MAMPGLTVCSSVMKFQADLPPVSRWKLMAIFAEYTADRNGAGKEGRN